MVLLYQTEDPKRALGFVEDRRNSGFDTWIEDESGKIVDEQALKKQTSAEVIGGLIKALRDYEQKNEPAWRS